MPLKYRLYRNHYADVQCEHLTVVEKAQSLANALIFLNSLLGLHSANDRPKTPEDSNFDWNDFYVRALIALEEPMIDKKSTVQGPS